MSDLQDRMRSLFGLTSEVEAYQTIHSQEVRYKNFTRRIDYKVPFEKLIPFMEQSKKLIRTKSSRPKENTESNIGRSLRRTNKKIYDIVHCNDFTLFITFTFDPKKTKDRYSPRVVKRQMRNWLKNQQRRYGKFSYLIVPERHKDGALHFHALFAGYTGKLVDSGKKRHGKTSYNLTGYTLGHTQASIIDDSQKAMNYLRKYITKDMPLFPGKHRYWASKGLRRPQVIDNPPPWDSNKTPLRAYENEYCVQADFARDSGGGDEA